MTLTNEEIRSAMAVLILADKYSERGRRAREKAAKKYCEDIRARQRRKNDAGKPE